MGLLREGARLELEVELEALEQQNVRQCNRKVQQAFHARSPALVLPVQIGCDPEILMGFYFGCEASTRAPCRGGARAWLAAADGEL